MADSENDKPAAAKRPASTRRKTAAKKPAAEQAPAAAKPAAKKSATRKSSATAKTAAKKPSTKKPAAKTPAAKTPAASVSEAELASEDVKALRDAADAGDFEAMRGLGLRYKYGYGIGQDYSKMEEWWSKAAEGGDSTSAWDLGYYHLIGKYLDKDKDKALKWFQLAADEGNADAALEIGLAYENGQFLDQDFDAASRWLSLASKLGNEKARKELGPLDKKRARARKLAERDARSSRIQPSGQTVTGDIILSDIVMNFGKKHVLNDITLTIQGKELVAVVGGSGGGKSTLLNIIRGELKPTSGSVEMHGTCGFVPQANLVHENLKVQEQLAFYASAVKKLPRDQRAAAIDSVINDLDLDRSRNNLISDCSGGEKRRVSVACELLSRPNTLFLDEPTSGLDPGDSGDLIDVLHGLVLNNGMSVLVINHDYENIELFDKIVFLAKGQICFYGTPSALFDYFDTTSAREIYDLMRANPDPFIRRFNEWRVSNPTVSGGIR